MLAIKNNGYRRWAMLWYDIAWSGRAWSGKLRYQLYSALMVW